MRPPSSPVVPVYRAALAVLGFLSAVAVRAQAPADAPVDCAQARTQRQLNACAYADFEAAQSAYAAVYRDLSAGLDAAQRTLLRSAQKDWLTYRTAACAFEAGGVRGGSAETMVRLHCESRMTRQRTAELRRHLACPEGDLACVRPRRP